MLRGYRLFVLAIGLILSAHHPNLEAGTKQAAAQERSAKALEDIAATYDKQAEGAERSPASNPCKPGDDQRNSDLCAQWKAADAAAVSAWWAAVGGFATAISTALVLIALWLAFRSNWIARDTAKRELRAYVTLGNVDMKFRSTKGGHKRWFIDIDLENKGQTPAFVSYFDISVSWHNEHATPDMCDIFFRSRDIQVVVASGKPFCITVEIEKDLSADPLHSGSKLIITGKVVYRDIFEQLRDTTYRLYADHDSWEKGAGVVSIHTSMTGNNCT